MASYDELLKLAEENSREAQKSLLEKKKKRELEEKRSKIQLERQREMAMLRQNKMIEVAKINQNKAAQNIRLKTLQNNKFEANRNINVKSVSKINNESNYKESAKVLVKNNENVKKPAHLMSFEELMNIAENNDKTKLKGKMSNDRPQMIKRPNSNPSINMKREINLKKVIQSSRPIASKSNRTNMDKTNINNNINNKLINKRMSIISNSSPKRKNAILSGSRFSKLGEIDNEMPNLKNKINKAVNKPTLASPILKKKEIKREEVPVRKLNNKSKNIHREVMDEEYAKNNISSIIGSIFGYDRNKYINDFSDDDDMEVSASRLRAEESRSARIAREEDEREEEMERQRMERLKKKKMTRKN